MRGRPDIEIVEQDVVEPGRSMRWVAFGEVRLREAVPGIDGILGCRMSERRGR